MIAGTRASVFDAHDELDISGFEPKPAKRSEIQSDLVKTVSEAAHFHSRDPKQNLEQQNTIKREPRRYRTGRNTQLNIKARPEAIEEFYAIADQQGWVLGEAFERAVDALKLRIEITK
jgi:hypothetical protein